MSVAARDRSGLDVVRNERRKATLSCSRRAATVSLSFTLFSYCPDENSQDPSCSAVSVPGAAFNTSWNDPPPAVKWHPTRSKQGGGENPFLPKHNLLLFVVAVVLTIQSKNDTNLHLSVLSDFLHTSKQQHHHDVKQQAKQRFNLYLHQLFHQPINIKRTATTEHPDLHCCHR